MSFSLKREIEFYINDVDSTNGVQKLAILPEFELKLQADLIQVFRKIIGEDPEMLPRSGVDQISPVALSFITYLKPSILDNKIGVTAPEKILYDSLGGVLGYRAADYYKVQFGRVNRLLPLYIFLKTTTAVYKVNLAYIDSLEISFDINYLLIGKWTAQAVSFEILDTKDVVFTNVIDYTSVENYIRSKFTVTTITDYYNGEKEYKFPITKSSIKITNTLMPVYDKNIKVVTGTVKDLIVGGRAISGQLSAYLSSRFDHSKDFIIDLYNDLTTVNRKFKVKYLATDGDKSVEIILPKALLNIPFLDFQDVLNVNIEFTSTESKYGLNDDISYKYLYNTSRSLTYTDYVQKDLLAEYYYKLNEVSPTRIYNYGTKGSTFDLIVGGGAPTTNLAGKYLNSKAWAFNSTYSSANAVKDFSHKKFISFWYNPVTTNANEWLFAYTEDALDTYILISRGGSLSGGGYRGISVQVCSSTFKFDIPATNTWYLFSLFVDRVTNKIIFYSNNIEKFNTTYATGGIVGNTISLGIQGGNSLAGAKFSELIICYKVLEEEVPSIVSKLYNIVDINEIVLDAENNSIYTDYTDQLISYPSLNDDYINTIKLFNPKAHWRFNDNDSNKIRDHITGNYPLVLSNRPELKLEGPLLNDKECKAVWFNKHSDGTFQYTTSTNPISTTGITKNTYVFWIYIDNDSLLDSNYRQCLLKTGSNTGSVYTLLHRSGGYSGNFNNRYVYNEEIYYNYEPGYGDGNYDCTYAFNKNIGIRLQKWTCIAYACNKTNNTIKMYVDGVLKNTITDSNVSAYWPSTIALEIGKRTYSGNYRSTFKISEFTYYERELSETSIQGIYASSGIRGFNITIYPVKTSINLNKYIPSVLRGQDIKVQKSSINIETNLVYSTIIKNILPQIGNNLILEYWDPELGYYENTPIIILTTTLKPDSNYLNIEGNIPEVYRIKFIIPQNGSINIGGYSNSLQSTIAINNNTVNIVGSIPLVLKLVSYTPQTGSININSYEIIVQEILPQLPVDRNIIILRRNI